MIDEYSNDNINNYMPPETLRKDIRDDLCLRLKKHFRLFQAFGIWIFGLSLMGAVSFAVSLFTDESWNEGNLASLPIKVFMLLIMGAFFFLLIKAAHWLCSFPSRKVNAVKDNEFVWKIGRVTQVSETYGSSSRDGYRKYRVVYVDNERVEMLHSSVGLMVGEEMYVFRIGEKNPITYASAERILEWSEL